MGKRVVEVEVYPVKTKHPKDQYWMMIEEREAIRAVESFGHKVERMPPEFEMALGLCNRPSKVWISEPHVAVKIGTGPDVCLDGKEVDHMIAALTACRDWQREHGADDGDGA